MGHTLLSLLIEALESSSAIFNPSINEWGKNVGEHYVEWSPNNFSTHDNKVVCVVGCYMVPYVSTEKWSYC